MRRVVVTGLGMLSGFGRGVEHNFKQLLDGKCAISKIDTFDLKDINVKIAAQVPWGEQLPNFNPDTIVPAKELKKLDKFILYGICAAVDAVEDSKWVAQTEDEKYRAGVIFGSGIGGLGSIYENSVAFYEHGARRISPFFIPSCLINMVAGNLSIRYGLKGTNSACSTACSTGVTALIDSYKAIAYGDDDLIVTGGSEAAVNVMALSGFGNMRALTSEFNEKPQEASRPWDKKRSGFVIGEGAGALVLEELDHALARGAKIYAEVVGYGITGDAYHITAPDGDGAYRAMKKATDMAKNHGVDLKDIGYVNAHGTSTSVGDIKEVQGFKKLFGDLAEGVSMSSTKSAIGHLLGAAGAVESVISIKALTDGICPPTLNLNEPDEEVQGLDLVPLKAKKKEMKAVMNNSFGFGGVNSSVVFKKFEE